MNIPVHSLESDPKHLESGYAREGDKVHLSLGFATNGNCPEELSGLYAGYIQNGSIYIVGSVVRYFYLAYRESLDGNVVQCESKVQQQLVDKLKASGWMVEQESYTSQGRIDILASKAGDKRIVEVKLGNGSNSMSHALGQLLFYSKFHPDASLWVYTPIKPDPTILSILNSFNVNFWEVNDNV